MLVVQASIVGSRLCFPAWLSLSQAVSLATLVVLFFTWKAIQRQGVAAEKLTEATQKQIETSKIQAEAAVDQQRLTRRQLEEALRPILLFLGEGSGSNGQRKTTLKNDGVGPALDIRWFYGALPERQSRELNPTIIAAKREEDFPYNWDDATANGICLIYKSLTGSKNATQITWKNGSMHTDYIEDIG